MTSHTGWVRVGVILLFVITFTLVGWMAPIMYATHAPAENFIEVHNFEAQNTSIDTEEHTICFDRTIHSDTTGQVFAELYLITGDGERIEVGSDTMDRYFQEGRQQIVTPFELPDGLEEGEYRYALVIQMELADGQAPRIFSFESDEFYISDGESRDTVDCE